MTGPSRALWALSGGNAGEIVQLKGLVGALNMAGLDLQPVFKSVPLAKPWCWLPSPLARAPVALLTQAAASLKPPLPQIVFSCGRQGAIVSRALTRRCLTAQPPAPLFRVHILDPRMPANHFDWVICPSHDRLRGPNVMVMEGSLNGITPGGLEALRHSGSGSLQGLLPNLFKGLSHDRSQSPCRPRVGVLLGGNTNRYTFGTATNTQILACVKGLMDSSYTPLILSSPRTPQTLKESVRLLCNAQQKEVFFYDGTGPNPYEDVLAWADFFVVTNDSVNMLSEACATQKPVFILELVDHQDTPPTRFAASLYQGQHARPLSFNLRGQSSDVPLPLWTPPPFAETTRIATQLGPLLKAFMDQHWVTP